ncbi:MAG: SUMF1/EgtB/PvdO family nonheme iron enzyme [Pseudomonadota bacterium]
MFITTAAHAQNPQRVALLIGNATYSVAPLRNPPNDVREMQAALLALGFKVQVMLNANQNQMKRAVRDFGSLAQGADVAFLYYSGHGTQANGENYLLPIGASIDKEADYEVEAVSANTLMRQIAGARPRAAIVVLDACRDNPYASVTKSTSKGLGRMDAPTGSMIAFATAPNNTASDNGDYARVLARQLQTPGLELFDVFRNTTAEVHRISKGKQEPRISEVSITERIYLAGQNNARPPVQVASVVPEPVQQPAAPATRPTIKDCADCPELVIIPAGSFMMGSNDGEANEKPVHRVSIKPFAMGKTEVTQAQWQAVMGSNASEFKNCGPTCPVENVSWNDAQEFITKLNTKTGQTYRLPSEAEWEYAARAGSQTSFWWGDSINTGQANYDGNYSYNGSPKGEYRQSTVPVNSFKANAYGLYNVHGNVWEWVEDVWHDNYGGAPTDGSAWTSGGDTARRVLRGGCYGDEPGDLRSAYRSGIAPVNSGTCTGFRIARTL